MIVTLFFKKNRKSESSTQQAIELQGVLRPFLPVLRTLPRVEEGVECIVELLALGLVVSL